MDKVETLSKVETTPAPQKGSKKKEMDLSSLVLDTQLNKYDMILLARRWAQELKSKEGEARSLHELIKVAIKDILSGDVSHKMVRDLPVLRNLKRQKGVEISFNINTPQSSSK